MVGQYNYGALSGTSLVTRLSAEFPGVIIRKRFQEAKFDWTNTEKIED